MSVVYSKNSHRKVFHNSSSCKLIRRVPKDIKIIEEDIDFLYSKGYRMCKQCSSFGMLVRNNRKEIRFLCNSNQLKYEIINDALIIKSRFNYWKIIRNKKTKKFSLYCINPQGRIASENVNLIIPDNLPISEINSPQNVTSNSILGFFRYICDFDLYYASLSEPQNKVTKREKANTVGVVDISSNDKVVHPTNCTNIQNIAKKNRLSFMFLNDALRLGYKVCDCCLDFEMRYYQEINGFLPYCEKEGLKFEFDGNIISVYREKCKFIIKLDKEQKVFLIYKQNSELLGEKFIDSNYSLLPYKTAVLYFCFTYIARYFDTHIPSVKEVYERQKERIDAECMKYGIRVDAKDDTLLVNGRYSDWIITSSEDNSAFSLYKGIMTDTEKLEQESDIWTNFKCQPIKKQITSLYQVIEIIIKRDKGEPTKGCTAVVRDSSSDDKIVHPTFCDEILNIDKRNRQSYRNYAQASKCGFEMCEKCKQNKSVLLQYEQYKEEIDNICISNDLLIEVDDDWLNIISKHGIWRLVNNEENSWYPPTLYHRNKYTKKGLSSKIEGYHKQKAIGISVVDFIHYLVRHDKYCDSLAMKKGKGRNEIFGAAFDLN